MILILDTNRRRTFISNPLPNHWSAKFTVHRPPAHRSLSIESSYLLARRTRRRPSVADIIILIKRHGRMVSTANKKVNPPIKLIPITGRKAGDLEVKPRTSLKYIVPNRTCRDKMSDREDGRRINPATHSITITIWLRQAYERGAFAKLL